MEKGIQNSPAFTLSTLDSINVEHKSNGFDCFGGNPRKIISHKDFFGGCRDLIALGCASQWDFFERGIQNDAKHEALFTIAI